MIRRTSPLRALLLVTTTLLSGCDAWFFHDDPDGGGESSSVTATVDGAPFEANQVMSGFIGDAYLVVATDTLTGRSIRFTFVEIGVGSHNVGTDVAAQWVEESGSEPGHYFGGVSGEILVEEFTETRLEATFNFTGDNEASAGKKAGEARSLSGVLVIALLAQENGISFNTPGTVLACLFSGGLTEGHPIPWWTGDGGFFLPVTTRDQDGNLVQLGANAQTFGTWMDGAGREWGIATGGDPLDVSLNVLLQGANLVEFQEYHVGLRPNVSSLSASVLFKNDEEEYRFRADNDHGSGLMVIYYLGPETTEGREIQAGMVFVLDDENGEPSLLCEGILVALIR